MEVEGLRILITKALGSKVDSGADLSQALYEAREGNEGADPILCDLIKALREVPALCLFDDRMHVVPNQAHRVNYDQLAAWLLQRTRTLGTNEALQDLSTFTEATEIPAWRVSAIEGLQLNSTCSLAPGIRLVPWSDVPETQSKKYIEEMRWQQARYPTAALLHDLALPKDQFFAKEAKSSPIFSLSFEDRDITLCAGLFGPVAPVIVASWFDFPSWYPTTGCGYSITGSVNERDDERPWPPDAYDVFPDFYKEYTALSQPDRNHLHIPLDRLNKAMRRVFPVDAAIDLGIALESLFLSDLEDERGELSFRLRLRGARYLGKTPAERKTFNKHLRLLYTARSIAVHTGTLPERIDHVRVKGLIESGYEIAAKTLRAMIRNGQPDWNEIVFS